MTVDNRQENTMNSLDTTNEELKRMRTHDSNHKNSFQLSNIDEYDNMTLNSFEGNKPAIEDSPLKRIPRLDSRAMYHFKD